MTNLKKIFGFLTLFLVSAFLCSSCSSGNSRGQELKKFKEANGKLKVFSSIAMIGDIVKLIGQDHIDTITLITGDLDPHSYQLVKGDDEKLAYADVIFFNGLGLEHGPSLQHYLENNPKAVAVGDKIMEKEPEIILKLDGAIDPHIWMDVSLWAKIVPTIVETLSAKDSKNANFYKENGDKLLKQMQDEHRQIKEILGSIPVEKRYLVTSHDAFFYFARAYLATEEEKKTGTWHDRFAAPEGLAPESQLSAVHIQDIINYLDKHKVKVLFPESNISKDSIKKIVSAAKEKGIDLKIADCCLYADAMGEKGSDGDTYLKMLMHDAIWIKTHVEGN